MNNIHKIILLIGLSILVSGCQKKEEGIIRSYDMAAVTTEVSEPSEQGKIPDICQQIYKTEYSRKLDNRECVYRIVQGLGKSGYAAVDTENQIDMTCANEVLKFLGKREKRSKAEISIICVSYSGGFALYDLKTDDGKVIITKSYYKYMNGQLTLTENVEYEPDVFDFTEEGYLIIEGTWSSEQKYALTLSEENEHIALRVIPLKDKYRELNRKYIKPVSYGLNNIFITEWDCKHYVDIDFYDVFVKFYKEVYKVDCPYVMNENLSVGEEYAIPSVEFENVIIQHFQVTEQELRNLLRYDSDTDCYLFRPRGFDEFDYMEIPYPEVVSYRENDDGTITLSVNAVYPNENTSKLFSHEVTVKEIDEKVYYLSNHIVDNQELNLWWHADRYTDEEWKEHYTRTVESPQSQEYQTQEEDISWMFSKVENELFSVQEKQQIENQVMSVVKNIWTLYEGLTVTDGPSYVSGINDFTKKQRQEVVSALGDNHVTAVSEDINMVNGEMLEAFYRDYQNKKDGMVTVYRVNNDGLIATVTFLYRNGEIQEYYAGIKPDANGKPQFTEKIVHEIGFIKLTEKGYFLYADKDPIAHASLCQYFRVSPLSEECRKLTEKYLKYFDCQKYNLLVTDWNAECASNVLQPGLFEDLYYIKYGENYRGDNEAIPDALFEEIMTIYLPVSVEQLRNSFKYDASKNTYCQETIYGSLYPPFLEITDYKYHTDGTITLYADGVWPDYHSDYAFTNVIVIRPDAEGTFQILSNDVTERELELPSIAHNQGRD